jgi:hypothetical protein
LEHCCGDLASVSLDALIQSPKHRNRHSTGQFYISSSTARTILDDNSDRFYLIRFSNGREDIAWAGIRHENGVDNWILYTNSAHMTTVVPIEPNQYYSISLQWDASERTAEMYVNGAKILQASTSGYSAVTEVDMGVIYTYRVQDPLTVYGDNFAILDN